MIMMFVSPFDVCSYVLQILAHRVLTSHRAFPSFPFEHAGPGQQHGVWTVKILPAALIPQDNDNHRRTCSELPPRHY